MLTRLRIQNFKGWEDTGDIRLAPITLFFGANSSGKSSISHFLMMLKQTVESQDRKAVFYPGGKNSAVQLGTYQDMVHHHDVERHIAFEYQWELPEELEIVDYNTKHEVRGNCLKFAAEIELSDSVKYSPQVRKFEYSLQNEGGESLSIELSKIKGKREYRLSQEKYIPARKPVRPWRLRDVVRFYGFPDEVVANHYNADFVQRFNFEHENLFDSIHYLGPLRTKTERLYTWGGIAPDNVGFSGENTIAAILSSRERKISLGYRKQIKPLEEIIALKLAEMGLIEEFKVNPISELRQEYEVKIRTKGSNDLVDLPDVGFGISQVLPVLVQCFYASPGSIILMEQPEIHLHPSAQSALADVMIDAINSRENGKDRNIQLIIETHSEHFLQRLQRRIAEDIVSESDNKPPLNKRISAYFADITKTPATLNYLDIDMFGNVLNWPRDFFGDEMGDIIKQSKAAMKKRAKR